MIKRKFLPPNFRCRVRRDGDTNWLMMRAERREDLATRLKAKDYEILDIVEYSFDDWLERARVATEEALETKGRKDYEFQEKIWSDLKQYLFEVFNGKCAYCESYVHQVAPGDVEHYRPKKTLNEKGVDHPGYYWLAYEVTNLLPSCEPCNRKRKRNRFPVNNGFWARCPGEVSLEQPLLLNPYNDNPREHLRFKPVSEESALSTVRGHTLKGEKSVDIYNLNRLALAERRGAVILQAGRDWLLSIIIRGITRDRFWRTLKAGEVEYSLAQIDQVNWMIEQEQERLRSLEAHLPEE
ncbi:MAG TPA: hypothetical protein VLB76_14755 [Thermoanaerobaculia bacterium]|jgi:hypothetical protein|nr:hypothetical protein [Thermoanaerobaculia bacterium]